MTPTPDSVDLTLRREALHLSIKGARSSVPMLWVATAIVAWPGRDWPGAWPLWLLGTLALISGLWRLWFMHRLNRPGPGLDPAALRACERQIQANALLSGVMWASATLILYPSLSPEQAALHICVLIGALSVASYYMSLIGRSFELIAVPMMLSLIGMALWQRSANMVPITIGSVVFLAAMLRATRHLRVSSRLSLRRGLEMSEANERLAAEAAAKTRFLATMGHELRLPMNGLQGALDLLQRESLTAHQRELALNAQRSSQDLLRALTALLDYSRLEADPPDPRPRSVALGDLCQSLIDAHQATAQAKGLRLHAQIADDVPGSVLVDPQWLRRVLDCLIDNALKFTERGRVELAVSAQPGQILHFEVSDSGIGIAAADQALLFKPFHQIDHGPQRAHAGSGLGLATAQRLVQGLGGLIRVDSAPGQGSRFSFSLQLPSSPAPAPAPEQAPGESAMPQLRGTVLVVEDDPANRLITTEMLGRSGLTVREATDGLQALSALHQGGIGLVLMDGQMPVLDGYEATRQWRQLEARLGLPRVPIIAVSANTLPTDVQLARDSGMDEHLPKPFGMTQLIDCVARWLPPAAANSAPAPAPAPQ